MESISQVIQIYLKTFLHPFETQRKIRHFRERDKWFQGHEGTDLIPMKRPVSSSNTILGIEESIAISWLMAAVYAFYEVFWIFLGLMFFEHHANFGLAEYFDGILRTNIQMLSKAFVIFWIFFKLTFFPVTIWFYSKFWMVVIRFFAGLFNYDDGRQYDGPGADQKKQQEIDQIADQVVCQAISSHALLLVPVFGRMLAHFLSVFYIFIGVRNNLGLSTLQSVAVIISPLILFGTMILVWFFSLFIALGTF